MFALYSVSLYKFIPFSLFHLVQMFVLPQFKSVLLAIFFYYYFFLIFIRTQSFELKIQYYRKEQFN